MKISKKCAWERSANDVPDITPLGAKEREKE